MVSPDTPPRSGRLSTPVLRIAGFVLAIALGGVAVWLIATGNTVKDQRIGALSGMWGVLIGAFAIFGSRRHDEHPVLDPSTALELRQTAALARSEDVASQREFQARLEALLRREVQEGVARELGGLRHEVNALRNEILEKVGGQLRMERTETTRLFGSNLEALQQEIRLLKVAQLGDTGTISAIDVAAIETTTTTTTEPSRVVEQQPPARPTSGQAPTSPGAGTQVPVAGPSAPQPDSADSEARLRAVTPPPAAAPPSSVWGEPASAGGFPPFRPLQPVRAFTTASGERPAAEPEPPRAQPESVVATAPPAPESPPEPTPIAAQDSAPLPPYAASTPAQDSAPLPPYAAPAVSVTKPEPSVPAMAAPTGPTSAPLEPAQPEAQAPAMATASPLGPNDPFATMPRIRPFTDFELDREDRAAAPAPNAPTAGRHSSAGAAPAPSAGGRRRRADDSDNDVLARILAREKGTSPEDD